MFGRTATALALLAAGYLSQDLWRPMLPDLGGAAQASASEPGVPAAPSEATPDPMLAGFETPRDYLLLPPDGALSVVLRAGPGAGFPEVKRLDMHDALVGRGMRMGSDGKEWVQVVRPRDGVSGYVREDTLLGRGQPALAAVAARDPEPSAARSRIETRFRTAQAQAQGYDRAYLAEGQKLWEARRSRCAEAPDPAGCRDQLDTARLADLDGWLDAGRTIRERPIRASLDSGR